MSLDYIRIKSDTGISAAFTFFLLKKKIVSENLPYLNEHLLSVCLTWNQHLHNTTNCSVAFTYIMLICSRKKQGIIAGSL